MLPVKQSDVAGGLPDTPRHHAGAVSVAYPQQGRRWLRGRLLSLRVALLLLAAGWLVAAAMSSRRQRQQPLGARGVAPAVANAPQLPSAAIKYVLVVDSGSSGTRMYVFNWTQPDATRGGGALPVVQAIPPSAAPGLVPRQAKQGMYTRVETQPGLDAFSGDPEGLSAAALGPLLAWARAVVPAQLHSSSPLFLLGTGGLRRMPLHDRGALMTDVRRLLAGSGFRFRDEWAKVISGTDEGVYGWLALNYARGLLQPPAGPQQQQQQEAQQQQHGAPVVLEVADAPPPTTSWGSLDLGGSSLELTFEVAPPHAAQQGGVADGGSGEAPAPPAAEHGPGELHNVTIGGRTFHLHTHTFRQYGLNDAYDRAVGLLLTEQRARTPPLLPPPEQQPAEQPTGVAEPRPVAGQPLQPLQQQQQQQQQQQTQQQQDTQQTQQQQDAQQTQQLPGPQAGGAEAQQAAAASAAAAAAAAAAATVTGPVPAPAVALQLPANASSAAALAQQHQMQADLAVAAVAGLHPQHHAQVAAVAVSPGVDQLAQVPAAAAVAQPAEAAAAAAGLEDTTDKQMQAELAAAAAAGIRPGQAAGAPAPDSALLLAAAASAQQQPDTQAPAQVAPGFEVPAGAEEQGAGGPEVAAEGGLLALQPQPGSQRRRLQRRLERRRLLQREARLGASAPHEQQQHLLPPLLAAPGPAQGGVSADRAGQPQQGMRRLLQGDAAAGPPEAGALGAHPAAAVNGSEQAVAAAGGDASPQLPALPAAESSGGAPAVPVVLHPCLHEGFASEYQRIAHDGVTPDPPRVLLQGRPDWGACLALVDRLVNATAPCHTSRHRPVCRLGAPQPRLQGSFLALTGFFVVSKFLRVAPDAALLDSVMAASHELCARPWADVARELGHQANAERYCTWGPYMAALLRQGLGLPDAAVQVGDFGWPLGAALAEAGRLPDFAAERQQQQPSPSDGGGAGAEGPPAAALGAWRYSQRRSWVQAMLGSKRALHMGHVALIFLVVALWVSAVVHCLPGQGGGSPAAALGLGPSLQALARHGPGKAHHQGHILPVVSARGGGVRGGGGGGGAHAQGPLLGRFAASLPKR